MKKRKTKINIIYEKIEKKNQKKKKKKKKKKVKIKNKSIFDK